jgi:hypothetical protein
VAGAARSKGGIMYERAILCIGAVSLFVALIAAVAFEILHPAREDPNNNPRSASSRSRTAGTCTWTRLSFS